MQRELARGVSFHHQWESLETRSLVLIASFSEASTISSHNLCYTSSTSALAKMSLNQQSIAHKPIVGTNTMEFKKDLRFKLIISPKSPIPLNHSCSPADQPLRILLCNL